MTSLAKQILTNKRRGNNLDELGIPTENMRGEELMQRPQYLVARTFLLESKSPEYDPDTTSRLHLRQDVIYRHNMEIEEDERNFYRLTGVGYKVEKRAQILYWMELRKRLPKLNPNIYKISDELWWDKKNGELIEGDKEDVQKKTN